eukprot:TRINITY_DN60593_c0_g1_i1.p1 TRINITY_DN60593_c0_g1~~TRINITY_DN60593_c0_g1_i1.p1  ORF type:complete len:404 (+),score=85.19 TRINITY_DN60593_c0_g1_i1:115-1212(+)
MQAAEPAVAECPVCYEPYAAAPPLRRPRVLPCGHGVCTRCAFSLASPPRCPCCRRPAPTPSDGGYVLNYALLDLLDRGTSSPEPAAGSQPRRRLSSTHSAPASPRQAQSAHQKHGGHSGGWPTSPVAPPEAWSRRLHSGGACTPPPSNPEPSAPLNVSVVVLGAGGVGKSALTLRYVQGYYMDAYDPGICDVYRKEDRVDGGWVLFEVFDTAGQEEYSAVRRQFYRSATAFILVYSMDNCGSVDEAEQLWDEVCRERGDVPPCVLVGHKCDITGADRMVGRQAEAFARRTTLPHIEASARADINILQVFHDVAREVARRMPKVAPPPAIEDAACCRTESRRGSLKQGKVKRKGRFRRRLAACTVM